MAIPETPIQPNIGAGAGETKKPTFISRIRNCTYLMCFALQGVLGLVYGPLMGMIQLKYADKSVSVFDTHGQFLIACAFTFLAMAVGFGVMIYTIIQAEDSGNGGGYPTTIGYQILSAVVLICVIETPILLIIVILVPHHKPWIGYEVLGIVAAIVAFFTLFEFFVLKVRQFRDRGGFAFRGAGARGSGILGGRGRGRGVEGGRGRGVESGRGRGVELTGVGRGRGGRG